MEISALIIYCMTIFAVSIIPGPSMALAFSHGMRYGLWGVVPAAIGNVVATLLQGVFAMFAIHSLLTLEPSVLGVLQALGAIYIGYVGVVFIKQREAIGKGLPRSDEVIAVAAARCFEGAMIAFFNPKAIMFFVALFPQFVNAEQVGVLAYTAIFLPIGSVALLCFMIYGAFGCAAVKLLNGTLVVKYFVPATGCLLLLVAVTGLVNAVAPAISMLL